MENAEVLVERKGITNSTNLWSLTEVFKLSPTTSQFEFESESYLVKSYVCGVEQLGRHFTVTPRGHTNTKIRLYTKVMCMLP